MRKILASAVLALAGAGVTTIAASTAAAPTFAQAPVGASGSSAAQSPTGASGASGAASKPASSPQIPPPPHEVGCWRYGPAAGWQQAKCATPRFISRHFPHPEVLSGIGTGSLKTSGPIDVSVVAAMPVEGQAGSESDSGAGSNAYSLQDNAFFTGNNGQPDGVQFTDQSEPWILGELNGVCVWQIVIPPQNYISNCADVLTGDHVELVEGTAWGGLLMAAAASPGNGTAIAVEVPDRYGLENDDRWNNSSGSILGLGNGSEALFSGTEEAIAMEDSSCLDDDGFIGYSVFCTARKLSPGAYTDYSPGPSTHNYETLETNNLIPVTGSPPAHLPTPLEWFYGGYTAQINYTATTTGHCWTGSLPYCE